jgi:hypothetical protein
VCPATSPAYTELRWKQYWLSKREFSGHRGETRVINAGSERSL